MPAIWCLTPQQRQNIHKFGLIVDLLERREWKERFLQRHMKETIQSMFPGVSSAFITKNLLRVDHLHLHPGTPEWTRETKALVYYLEKLCKRAGIRKESITLHWVEKI